MSVGSSVSHPSFWHRYRHKSFSSRPFSGRLVEYDVAIVGAGLTGVATALHLISRDSHLRVAVVEERFPGFGATGRSSGIVYADDQYLPGSEAALDYAREFTSKQKISFGVERKVVEVSSFDGEFPAVLLNPQSLIDALYKVSVRKGVSVFLNRRVTDWHELEDRVVLSGKDFEVRAYAALLATGAYSSKGDLDAIGLDTSVAASIVVEVNGHINRPWNFAKVLDSKNDCFVWGRSIGETRFLYGEELDQTLEKQDVSHRLYSRFTYHLPEISRNSRIISVWYGLIDRFNDRRRWRCMQMPNSKRAFVTAGYDGQGISFSFVAGNVSAETLLEHI